MQKGGEQLPSGYPQSVAAATNAHQMGWLHCVGPQARESPLGFRAARQPCVERLPGSVGHRRAEPGAEEGMDHTLAIILNEGESKCEVLDASEH